MIYSGVCRNLSTYLVELTEQREGVKVMVSIKCCFMRDAENIHKMTKIKLKLRTYCVRIYLVIHLQIPTL
jgi:hypothetical protein